MEDSKALLTIPEAAHRLSVAQSTAWALVASGQLRTVRIGRARRVPVAAISEFIERASEAEAAGAE